MSINVIEEMFSLCCYSNVICYTEVDLQHKCKHKARTLHNLCDILLVSLQRI